MLKLSIPKFTVETEDYQGPTEDDGVVYMEGVDPDALSEVLMQSTCDEKVFQTTVIGYPSTKGAPFSSIHVFLDMGQVTMDVLYKAVSELGSDGELHLWFCSGFALQEKMTAGGLTGLLQNCRCRTVAHLCALHTIPLLYVAANADAIEMSEGACVVLMRPPGSSIVSGLSPRDMEKALEHDLMANRGYCECLRDAGLLTSEEERKVLDQEMPVMIPAAIMRRRIANTSLPI